MDYEPLVASNIIVELIPLAIAVALTPMVVTATLLFLSSSRPLPRALPLVLGSMIAQTVVCAVGVWALEGAIFEDDGDSPRWMLWGETIAGLVLVLIGGRTVWLAVTRPRDGTAPPCEEGPRWLQAVDRVSPIVAFAIGVTNATANIGNLFFSLGGAADVSNAELSVTAEIAAILLFVVLSHITVLVPIVAYIVAPARSEEVLGPARKWLGLNTRLVLGTVLLLVGLNLALNGAGALHG